MPQPRRAVEVKLAADDVAGIDPDRTAVLLHHLGLPDEQVVEVPWADIDRTLEADHLTALWVPRLAAPVAAELVGLEELVRTLRAKCPWDRGQTHGSLGRHLLEEAYEALDAIEAVAAAEPDVAPDAVAHLEEELGDLLFQVYFHALLAAEEGRFTLADVARTVHDKLVRAIRMSSATPWPTRPRTWRRAGRSSRRPKRVAPA